MLDVLFLLAAVALFAITAGYVAVCDSCEGSAMLEPIAGLAVALLLGGYLLYTLIHPERF